jgi:hypothetical protein
VNNITRRLKLILVVIIEVVYWVRNKLIISIPTGFNCNKVLGYPGFQLRKILENTYKNKQITR